MVGRHHAAQPEDMPPHRSWRARRRAGRRCCERGLDEAREPRRAGLSLGRRRAGAAQRTMPNARAAPRRCNSRSAEAAEHRCNRGAGARRAASWRKRIAADSANRHWRATSAAPPSSQRRRGRVRVQRSRQPPLHARPNGHRQRQTQALETRRTRCSPAVRSAVRDLVQLRARVRLGVHFHQFEERRPCRRGRRPSRRLRVVADVVKVHARPSSPGRIRRAFARNSATSPRRAADRTLRARADRSARVRR